MSERQNVYQMWQANGGGGFAVRRNSWAPSSVAVVVGLADPLQGKPPYFQNPAVLATLYRPGRPPLTIWLSCAGTFGYELVDRAAARDVIARSS